MRLVSIQEDEYIAEVDSVGDGVLDIRLICNVIDVFKGFLCTGAVYEAAAVDSLLKGFIRSGLWKSGHFLFFVDDAPGIRIIKKSAKDNGASNYIRYVDSNVAALEEQYLDCIELPSSSVPVLLFKRENLICPNDVVAIGDRLTRMVGSESRRD